MGGKNKQAHRTKNNVRPSSSGRSAELLVSGGEGAYRAAAALFPTLAAAATDAALQPDLALALKKLNKKDPITKCKALQELTELVRNNKAEEVSLMLPQWAHVYRALAVDPDRRVRELTQACHGHVMAACGRRAAPQLKALLPAWLTAQHDEHAPAQARARHALHNTFPDNKLAEAISFCRVEILQHLIDNLLDTNAAVNKKLEDAEERQAAWARVASSALAGLRYVAGALPAAHGAWLWGRLQPPLGAPAYWRLAAHAAPDLRAAWYGATGALAARFGPQWGAACGARALKVLLNAKEGAAPSAAAAQWGALLSIMTHDPEWYDRIEKKELVMKRLLETLEAGGWGDARGLAQLLPRLLERLPAAALEPAQVAALFQACFTGLGRRAVLLSPRERQAWLAAVAAAIRHVADRSEVAPEAAATAVRLWLRTALGAAGGGGAGGTAGGGGGGEPLLRESADCLATLLDHWTTHNAGAELLVRGVWQSLASTAGAQVAELAAGGGGGGGGGGGEGGRLERLLRAHSLLLLTLRAALLQEQQPKKRRGVRFEDELTDDTSTEVQEPPPPPPPPPLAPPSASIRLHRHHLEEAAERILANYLELTQTAPAPGHAPALFKGLLPLFVALDSKDIWTGVGRSLGGAGPRAVWERALRPCLVGGGGECGPLVETTLLLLPHLEPEEQADVFSTIDQVGGAVSERVVCACACVAAPAPAAGAWLRGAGARAALLRLLARALGGEGEGEGGERDALLGCVDASRPLGPPVGEETVSLVLATAREALTAALSAPAQPEGCTHTARVCAELATRVRCAAPLTLDPLLLALFQYDLQTHSSDGSEADASDVSAVRRAWRDAVRALGAARAQRLVDGALRLLGDYLARSPSELRPGYARHAAALCACVCEFRRAADVLRGVARAAPAARAHALPHALRYACVAGELACPLDDTEPAASVAAPAPAGPSPPLPSAALLLQYGRDCLLRGALLTACARAAGEGGEGEGDGEAARFDERLVDELADLLYDHALIANMEKGYAFWSGYKILEEIRTELTPLVEAVLAACPDGVRSDTLAVLKQRAAVHGHYWAHAHARHRAALRPAGGDASTDPPAPQGEEALLTGDGFFHTVQAELAFGECVNELEARRAVMLRCLVAAHGAADPELRAAAAAPAPPAPAAADLVIDAYYRHNQTMLYDTDVSAAAWGAAVCTGSVCDFLAALVRAPAPGAWDAPAHVWDFVTISLTSVLAALDKSKHAWGCTKVALVACAAARLCGAVAQFVGGVRAEAERRRASDHVAALPREWADVFQPEAARCVYGVVAHILESVPASDAPPLCASRARALWAWCALVRLVPYSALPPAARAQLPLPRMARAAAAALAGGAAHAHKYLAFHTLAALTEPLVQDDADKLRVWSARADGEGEAGAGAAAAARPDMALDYLAPALAQAATRLGAALAERPPGGGAELEPHSPAYTLALGCLQLAVCAGGVWARPPPALALHYRQLVAAHALPAPLLAAALQLLPPPLAAYAADPSAGAQPPRDYDHCFLAAKDFSVDEPPLRSDVGALACRVLAQVVGGAGGAARSWWGASDVRTARALSRLVAAYVTPALVRAQLRDASAGAAQLEDADVCVRWAAREITCALTVDERRVDITIALAKDHPLSLPKISAEGAAAGGAGGTQWLAVYLAYQQGSLRAALRMWAAGVSARVGAAPVCYICYCRLQPSSGRLPSALCHQCRNKFHPECLRKWFTTSNKSNCPLCRASF